MNPELPFTLENIIEMLPKKLRFLLSNSCSASLPDVWSSAFRRLVRVGPHKCGTPYGDSVSMLELLEKVKTRLESCNFPLNWLFNEGRLVLCRNSRTKHVG